MMTDRHWQRFWSRVDKTPGLGPTGDCWEWRAGCFDVGYGAFCHGGQNHGAHRIVVGLEDPDKCACHTCDNRRCVNPAHIFIGTKGDNNRDTLRKGRHRVSTTRRLPRGEQHHNSKLTEWDVRRMRGLRLLPEWTLKKLSQEFSIAISTVDRIVQRQWWSHI